MTVDELMGRIKLYENHTPEFGHMKKMVVVLTCDGVEMGVSSDGSKAGEFSEERHREQVREKLGNFLTNRPLSRIG